MQGTQTDTILRLCRSLYGLRQAPRCFQVGLFKFLEQSGYVATISDPCVFTKRLDDGSDQTVLAHVDDLLIMGTNAESNKTLHTTLLRKYKAVTWEEECTFFVGTQIERLQDGGYKLSMPGYCSAITRDLGLPLKVRGADGNGKIMEYPVLSPGYHPSARVSEIPIPDRDLVRVRDRLRIMVGRAQCCLENTHLEIADDLNKIARTMHKPTNWTVLRAELLLLYLMSTPTTDPPITHGSVRLSRHTWTPAGSPRSSPTREQGTASAWHPSKRMAPPRHTWYSLR